MSGDDWEEDDWENEESVEAKLEAAKKEKERARRREEGLESESESDKEPKAVTPKAAAPSPKAAEAKKAAPKAKQKDKNKKKETVVDERLLDPEAEKLRLRKLEEEQNLRAAADLFGMGPSQAALEEKARKEDAERTKATAAAAKVKIITVDAWDDVTLKVQADVDQLCQTCLQKLQKGTCKGAQFKFITDLVKLTEEMLTTKELGELEKQLSDIVKEQKKPKGATVVKGNKANTKVSKTTKFNTANEWEDVYGGGGDDDEWTQEEWDEWEKQQAAAWKDKA